MNDYKERFNFWTSSPIFDEETKKELLAIKEQKEAEEQRMFELKQRKRLEKHKGH